MYRKFQKFERVTKVWTRCREREGGVGMSADGGTIQATPGQLQE